MKLFVFLSATMLLMSQAVHDPLARTADEAAQRLRAEERRFQLGVATNAEVQLLRRELTRAQRAIALRDNSRDKVAESFEREVEISLLQLDDVERRYQLGAADESAVVERKRDLVAVRRSAAEWRGQNGALPPESRSVARQQAKAFIEDEIALVQRQLQMEERQVDAGALTSDVLATRRAEIADLQASLKSYRR